METPLQLYKQTNKHAHTCIHICIHIYIYTQYICIYVRHMLCIYIYMYVYIYICIYVYMYIYIYIYIHICMHYYIATWRFWVYHQAACSLGVDKHLPELPAKTVPKGHLSCAQAIQTQSFQKSLLQEYTYGRLPKRLCLKVAALPAHPGDPPYLEDINRKHVKHPLKP